MSYVDKIIHGDCLPVLTSLPENTFDLIVTSPPYANSRKKSYGGIPANQYVEWFLPISEQLRRILKPHGSLVLNIKERVIDGERGIYVYELVLAMRRQGWLWTEDYVWHKKNTMPGKWPNRFRDLWEHCFHFTKNRSFRMFQEAVMEEVGDWSKTRLRYLSPEDKKRNRSKTGSPFGRILQNWVGRTKVFPGNVLYLPSPNVFTSPSESRNVNHSAAFPLALPGWFIKLFTKEGDIVLDPFLGSGTTAVAAATLGRHYTGIELKQEYCQAAMNRLSKLNNNKLSRGTNLSISQLART